MPPSGLASGCFTNTQVLFLSLIPGLLTLELHLVYGDQYLDQLYYFASAPKNLHCFVLHWDKLIWDGQSIFWYLISFFWLHDEVWLKLRGWEDWNYFCLIFGFQHCLFCPFLSWFYWGVCTYHNIRNERLCLGTSISHQIHRQSRYLCS